MPQSEKEKMLAGELYRSTDCELQGVMAEAQRQLRCLNAIPNEDSEQRFAVLRVLLGEIGSGTQVKSPFACDYGAHIRIGRNGFVNYGCVFLDCNFITIGDDAQIAPGVHIYAALHPVDPGIRRSGLEAAKPVNIGHNVWLGGALRHLSGGDDWRQHCDRSWQRSGTGHSCKPGSCGQSVPDN